MEDTKSHAKTGAYRQLLYYFDCTLRLRFRKKLLSKTAASLQAIRKF